MKVGSKSNKSFPFIRTYVYVHRSKDACMNLNGLKRPEPESRFEISLANEKLTNHPACNL